MANDPNDETNRKKYKVSEDNARAPRDEQVQVPVPRRLRAPLEAFLKPVVDYTFYAVHQWDDDLP